MSNVLVFEENSNTIRQRPQNYLVAYNQNGRWVCDPDIAVDPELAMRVFKSLFDYETRYGNGLNLLSKVTPNGDFK